MEGTEADSILRLNPVFPFLSMQLYLSLSLPPFRVYVDNLAMRQTFVRLAKLCSHSFEMIRGCESLNYLNCLYL